MLKEKDPARIARFSTKDEAEDFIRAAIHKADEYHKRADEAYFRASRGVAVKSTHKVKL